MLGRLSRILVVDGDAASRHVTHKLLQSLGYQTIDYAQDAYSGLRQMGRNNYRLVLADWDMTPVDGQELLKQARLDQRLGYLPFLMAIGRWQKKFIEIVRDDGATLYLTKPFTIDILGERMTQVYGDAKRLQASRMQAASLQDNSGQPLASGQMPPSRGNTTIPMLWQFLQNDQSQTPSQTEEQAKIWRRIGT